MNSEKYTKDEQDIVARIDAGEKLTQRELSELVWNFDIHTTELDSGRWTQYVETIVELCGRTFCIGWHRGLTECQENEYDHQPIEVRKHVYEKTITVTEWIPVNSGKT